PRVHSFSEWHGPEQAEAAVSEDGHGPQPQYAAQAARAAGRARLTAHCSGSRGCVSSDTRCECTTRRATEPMSTRSPCTPRMVRLKPITGIFTCGSVG